MGYPLGAKYDPRAPYNKTEKIVKVCVSATYHTDLELVIEGEFNRDSPIDHLIKDELWKTQKHMEENGWYEDEFEYVIDDVYDK